MNATGFPETETNNAAWRPVSSRERLLIALLLLAGFGLRAYGVSDLALDHFDESAYAYSATGLTYPHGPRFLFPGQMYLSPPVYFSLIAVSYFLHGGSSDTAAILPNVLLGTLTIVLMWAFARRWFGPAAGLAAGALVALNEFHIRLSRMALADVAFAFAFLLALACIAEAYRRQTAAWAILAGAAVGLAWNTKYHGWLALAMAGLGYLLYAWQNRVRLFAEGRAIRTFLIAAITAGACYLPWALLVQFRLGGYRALSQRQSGFLSLNWLPNLWEHMQAQFYFEGPLSRASVFAALLCALLMAGGRAPRKSGFLWALGLCALSFLVGASGVAVILGLLAVPRVLRKPAPYANWLLATSLLSWMVLAPFYRAYPRLILPLLLGAFLLAARWMAEAADGVAEGVGNETKAALAYPAFAAIGAVAMALLPSPAGPERTPWQVRGHMPQVASLINQVLPKECRVIALGEPALLYYLHMTGRGRAVLEHPRQLKAADADGHIPIYVVVGYQALKNRNLFTTLERPGMQLVLEGKFYNVPTEMVLLDILGPNRVREYLRAPDAMFELRLYRYAPIPAKP